MLLMRKEESNINDIKGSLERSRQNLMDLLEGQMDIMNDLRLLERQINVMNELKRHGE